MYSREKKEKQFKRTYRAYGTLDSSIDRFIVSMPSYNNLLKEINTITINKVKKNGGKLVLAKVPIADFTFFTQINDTEGNLISLWEDRG